MNEKVELSIIIPVYNVEQYIEKCYSSVTKGDIRFNYEIIFVNDGSTDKSLEVLERLVQKDSFITIISQENQGLSGARNTGIAAARGKYILFLDSDDWLNFDVIQKLLPVANANELDLLSYGLEFFDEHNNSIGERDKHPLQYFKILTGKQALIQGFQPSSSCLFLYRTEFLNQHNLRFFPRIAQQDVEFTTRIMLYAERVYFSDLIGYNYYRHSGTISLPTSTDKLKKYLSDAIIVAQLIKDNLKYTQLGDVELRKAVEKNYNSVIWNLFWRFLTKPKEVDYGFKEACIEDLKTKKLYPIKGELKSNFQKLVRVFFNAEILLKVFLKVRN